MNLRSILKRYDSRVHDSASIPSGETGEVNSDVNPMFRLFARSGKPLKAGFLAMLFLLAVSLYATAFQGSRGLWERDEGRYTNIAVQMIRSGDFLLPAFNDDVHHFAKPPLTYWAVAAGIGLLGWNEWGVRLPNALAFIGTILVVLALGKTFLPKKRFLPPLIYASFLLPFGASNFVTTDTLLAFWEAVGVLGFVRWRSNPEENRSALLLLWTGFALAFLTKGPPALLPVLGIAAFVILKDGWRKLGRLVHAAGVAIFVLLGLGWFLIVAARTTGLTGYFLMDEILHRVASGASFNRNSSWYGAFIIYLPTLIGGTLPWTFFLLRAGRSLPRTLLARGWWRVKLAKDPWAVFLFLWVLIPLCVFFISRSRLPLYLLPLFVPISLITSRLVVKRPLGRLGACMLVVWLVGLVALKWGASQYPYSGDGRRMARAITEAVSPTPSELVFVDTTPFFGLGFYLNCEVEQVLCRPERNSREEILEVELARQEPGTLLVVPRERKPGLMALLAELGYAVRDIAEVHKWSIVSHTAEFESKKKVPENRVVNGAPAESS
jgi:4-amino-4-deoxy-L-arabinose transferase-like glycosyltransferase